MALGQPENIMLPAIFIGDENKKSYRYCSTEER